MIEHHQIKTLWKRILEPLPEETQREGCLGSTIIHSLYFLFAKYNWAYFSWETQSEMDKEGRIYKNDTVTLCLSLSLVFKPRTTVTGESQGNKLTSELTNPSLAFETNKWHSLGITFKGRILSYCQWSGPSVGQVTVRRRTRTVPKGFASFRLHGDWQEWNGN